MCLAVECFICVDVIIVSLVTVAAISVVRKIFNGFVDFSCGSI